VLVKFQRTVGRLHTANGDQTRDDLRAIAVHLDPPIRAPGDTHRPRIAVAHDIEPNAGARIHAAAFFGCVRLRFKASIRLMGFSPSVLQRLGLG
jgi:hypothetical protein